MVSSCEALYIPRDSNREILTFILVYKDSRELIEDRERSRGGNGESDLNKKYHIYFKKCLILESEAFQANFVND